MRKLAAVLTSLLLSTTPLLSSDLVETTERYVGGDISLLPDYENAGAKYFDHDGTPINDLLPYLFHEGMNAMRVRLFVNPDDYDGPDKDSNACQSLDYILPLCKRIKDDGFKLMLDFHYSDTWADPGKQWTPKAWADLTDNELYQTIHNYTAETLRILKENGVIPDFIQTGNEISFGMLWGPYGTPENELKKTFLGNDANWERLGRLLKEAISACHEECPETEIVLHTERTADIAVQDNFYTRMKEMDIDYDIIGLSYYPFFHGPLSQLNAAITSLENKFPTKQIMVVETGYSYEWDMPGTTWPLEYPNSDAGQNAFTQDLVNTLESHENVTGLFWWWMEYNAYGTTLQGWYNAPLFDSRTGRATSALKTLCSFASSGSDIEEIRCDERPTPYYNLQGIRVKHPSSGYFIHNRKLIFVP